MTTFYQHPTYRKRRDDWIRYRNLYTANRSALLGIDYLWPHALELKPDGKDLRLTRERRTRYLNIPEIVVSLLLSYLFAKPPKLDEAGKKQLEGAEANVDGKRNSWISFLRDEFTKTYLVYGKAAILTDAFPLEAETRAEESAVGARPFWELLEPLEIVDWSEETSSPARVGSLNWIRQEADLVLGRTSASQQPEAYRYSIERRWSSGSYTVIKYRKKIEDTEISEPNLNPTENGGTGYSQVGEEASVQFTDLPIAMLEDQSWIHDVCEETLRHYNLRSAKDNVLHYQGYQKLFARGISANDSAALKALAEYVISLLPEGGDAFAIEPADTSAIERAEAQALESALKMGLNQLRTLPSDSKEAQSADSTYAEKLNTTQLLAATIEEIESAANTAMEHWAEFAGVKPGRIEMNREINEQQLETVLLVATSFKQELDKYPEINKELVKKVLYKMFDEATAEELEQIVDKQQIEQPTTNTKVNLLGSLLNGRGPNSPADKADRGGN